MSLSLFRAAFTCGVLSLMGLYHLMLYYQWREDARTLWFGVFCLLVTVRTFLIEAGPIGYLRLEYLTIVGAAWIALRYLNSVFGYLKGSWILRASSISSVALVVWVVFGPEELVRQQKWVLQLNLLAAFVVSLQLLWWGFASRHPFSNALVLGFVPMVAGGVNDILAARHLIQTPQVVHYVTLYFVLVQSYMLAKTFSNTLIERDQASAELLRSYEAIDRELLQRDRLIQVNGQVEKEIATTNQQLIQADRMASLGKWVSKLARDIELPAGEITSGRTIIAEGIDAVERDLKELIGPVDLANPDQVQIAAKFDKAFRESKDRLRDIDIGGRRIKSINSAILSQSNTADWEKGVVIGAIVEECQIILNSKLKMIEFELKCHWKAKIECRKSQIGQVLTNLISNSADAVKDRFGAGAGGKIRVTASVVDKSVEVLIEDNGPGIPTSMKQKILEPFFTTKPVGSGTGLGMPIVVKIITDHGGKLEVLDSAALKGACMKITLPIERAHV